MSDAIDRFNKHMERMTRLFLYSTEEEFDACMKREHQASTDRKFNKIVEGFDRG